MESVTRSLRLCLFLAAAAHASVLGALSGVRLPPSVEAPSPVALQPMELEFFELPAGAFPPSEGSPPLARASRTEASVAAPLSPRLARTASRDPLGAASASVEAPASPAMAPPGGGLLPDDRAQRGQRAIASLLRGEGVGLTDPGASRGPRAEAPSNRAAEVLHESLDEADRQKGLGAGGPCATQAQVAMRMAGAPTTGRGTFEIVTDERGKVIRVSLLDSNAPGLEKVRDALFGLLQSQWLRIPAGAKGMRIQVRVEARVQMPSGMREGKHVEFSGLGGQFDLADIGATPVRVVSARVVGEQRL